MINKIKLKTTFDYLNFNYDTHTYFDKENNIYKSVTTKIHEFFPKFDKENIIDDYCIKYGLNRKIVEETWDLKMRYASFKGSSIHFYIHNFFIDLLYKPLIDVEKEILYFKNFLQDTKLKYMISEYMVGCKELRIAGTLDCLFYKNGKYYLIDWKTNEDIYKKFYNTDLTMIDQYKCQLSLYKYIIEKYLNIKIHKIVLVWLNKNNDNYKAINVNYSEEFINKKIIGV